MAYSSKTDTSFNLASSLGFEVVAEPDSRSVRESVARRIALLFLTTFWTFEREFSCNVFVHHEHGKRVTWFPLDSGACHRSWRAINRSLGYRSFLFFFSN